MAMAGREDKPNDLSKLRVELATYEQQRAALLAQATGQWVLIRGEEIVGIYPEETTAIREGFQRFGHVAFLVRHIVEVEPLLVFTSPLISP